MTKKIKHFGLIGKTLEHSFSKHFFTEKFKKENNPSKYHNFELKDINLFPDLIQQHPGLAGLNVTIPYKTSIIPYLDNLDPIAEKINAVNTILLKDENKIGFNTDVYGFKQSIKPFLSNHHERALILGTGGASKAVQYVLEEIGIDVAFLTRMPSQENHFSYDQANQIMMQHFKLIINTTPLGTFPEVDKHPPIPLHFFGENHLIVDLIYNPEETVLVQAAKNSGATTLNGLSMLKHQALKAWEIWNK